MSDADDNVRAELAAVVAEIDAGRADEVLLYSGPAPVDFSDAAIDRRRAEKALRGDGAARAGGEAHAERPPTPLRALDVLALAGHKFPEREELLGPLIHAGDLCMWFASRGVGKTQVMLSLSAALAFGGTFLRWKAAKPVGVLYLDGEMAGRVMQERIAAFLPERASETLAGNLRVFTPDLLDFGQALPDLATKEGQNSVEMLIDETTKVIAIDNLSAWCRTGKENESESWTIMSDWLLTLRRRGIAVLLVHHAGKGGQQRGTSKREDALDLCIQLARSGDYDPKSGASFTWSVSKGRHLHGGDAADLDMTLAIDDGVARWEWKDAEISTAARVSALAEEGMTVTMIAEELGINRSTAWRALKKLGKVPADK